MEEKIVKTLSYFDIFDYPLTFSEIKKYTEFAIDFSDEELDELIDSISIIQERGGYYYLLGRGSNVTKRTERSSVSMEKFTKAKIISKMLSFIPTIEYIGVSGSLSMHNSSPGDDIDLFFITKRNTLWLTRLIVNVFLTVTNQKRDRKGSKKKDRICPNMFAEVGSLHFARSKRTLYTAHEILQLKTLFDRNNAYSQFLNKNRWITSFFPNFEIQKIGSSQKKTSFDFFIKRKVGFIVNTLERSAYFLQRRFMKNITNETVHYNRAYFHPVDRQKIILDMHELRYKRYLMLLNDNFWVDKEEARFYLEEKKIRILN